MSKLIICPFIFTWCLNFSEVTDLFSKPSEEKIRSILSTFASIITVKEEKGEARKEKGQQGKLKPCALENFRKCDGDDLRLVEKFMLRICSKG